MSDVALKFNAHEAAILRYLTEQMRSLLRESNPDNPVHARLFPDAYENPKDAADYREIIGGDLSVAKLESLERVAEALGSRGGARITLTPDDADAWIRALTDMRLAIGTRLDVTAETMDEEPDPDDPRFEPLQIMHWLGWLQESILDRMVP